MNNALSTVKHWSGVVIATLLKVLQTGDRELTTYAPDIEKAMHEGATMAVAVPGIGPEVAMGLNLGAELTGALEKVLHYTDESFQQIVAQAQAAVPAGSGYSVVLIPEQLKAEAMQWFAQVKPVLLEVKASAQAVTGAMGAPAAATTVAAPVVVAPVSTQ